MNPLILIFLLSYQDTLALSFDQALERAYRCAPNARIAGVTIEQKAIEQEKVLSEFFPKFTAQAQHMRMDEIPSFKTDISGIPIEFTLGDERIELLQAGVQLPVWTFGRRLQGYALAGEAVELSRLDSLEQARALRMDIAEIFYNILYIDEAMELTQSALDNSKTHSKEIEDKYNQGLVSQYDLLKVRTKEKELTPELVDLTNQRDKLLSQLAILLNLGEDTLLVLEKSNAEADEKTSAEYNLDSLLSKRPAFLQLELGLKMLDRQIKLKQREALPAIGIGANYTVQRSPLTGGDWGSGWSYSIAAQAPISSGFVNYAEVKRLEKEKEKIAIQKEALIMQIKSEIREAQGLYETSLARFEAAKAREKEAEELVSIVSKRYREGLASDIDLIDAQLGLRKARVDRLFLEKNILIARERLTKATGGRN